MEVEEKAKSIGSRSSRNSIDLSPKNSIIFYNFVSLLTMDALSNT